ncbi:unnamed protein product [Ixodes persulcatus]
MISVTIWDRRTGWVLCGWISPRELREHLCSFPPELDLSNLQILIFFFYSHDSNEF